MAEIINLNKARKARGKAARAQKAVENRAAFGRTKAEKAADRAEAGRVARAVNAAKRET